VLASASFVVTIVSELSAPAAALEISPRSATVPLGRDERRARRGRPGALAEHREPMFAVLALREIRQSIQDAGLIPPRLPKPLAWIDKQRAGLRRM
jgi:hypothetical protein